MVGSWGAGVAVGGIGVLVGGGGGGGAAATGIPYAAWLAVDTESAIQATLP